MIDHDSKIIDNRIVKNTLSSNWVLPHHVKASSAKSITAPFPIQSQVLACTSSAKAPGPQTETTVAPTHCSRISSRTTSSQHHPGNICTVALGKTISQLLLGLETKSLMVRISQQQGSWRNLLRRSTVV